MNPSLRLLIKVTNDTTGQKKIAKNGPKEHNKLFFFALRAKKASAEGRSPLQKLEVGPHSGLYFLVPIIT